MKLITFCLMLFLVMGFYACGRNTNAKNTLDGTPSRADTVMPHTFDEASGQGGKHNEHAKGDSSNPYSVPGDYRR